MNVRRMGRTGLKVSEVCLGTMTFGNQCDERLSFAIMDKAAEQGARRAPGGEVGEADIVVTLRGRHVGRRRREILNRMHLLLLVLARGHLPFFTVTV